MFGDFKNIPVPPTWPPSRFAFGAMFCLNDLIINLHCLASCWLLGVILKEKVKLLSVGASNNNSKLGLNICPCCLASNCWVETLPPNIPSADDVGVIRYDSNYPVYVDCNNREAISLKNIKLRIIRQDGSRVESQGLSTATLLIDEK